MRWFQEPPHNCAERVCVCEGDAEGLFCPHVVQTLQKHHHPDVSKAAALINTPLLQQEEDLSEILEMTTYQVSLQPDLHPVSRTSITTSCCSPQLMEQELKQTGLKNVPLEFEAASRLLQGGGGVLGQHFCLSATC